MTFNAQDYLIDMNRGRGTPRWYLPVAARIMWFRDAHPDGSITTEVIDLPRNLIRATITDGTGRVIATGLGSTPPNSERAVWNGREFEKAETAAIGRALAHAGYGTQFLEDEDGSFIADSPVERQAPPPAPAPRPADKPAQPRNDRPPASGRAIPKSTNASVRDDPAPVNGAPRPYTTKQLYQRLREIAFADDSPAVNVTESDTRHLAIEMKKHMDEDTRHHLLIAAFDAPSSRNLTKRQCAALLKWLGSDPEVLKAEVAAVAADAPRETPADPDAAFAALGENTE